MGARRRRRVWSAVAMVLVASACRESEEPAPVEPGPVVPGLAERCPDKATPIPYPPNGRLSEGAVGVRLCNGVEDVEGDRDNEFDVQVPVDELTTDVADLVEVVNLSESAASDGFCPADAGPDLVFWFRYDDGTARAVHYQPYGCRWLVVGDDMNHTGGEDLHVAFDERLSAQRSLGDGEPPDAVPAPSCDPEQELTPLDLAARLSMGLGSAGVCIQRREGGPLLVAILNEQQLARVERDFQPRREISPDPCPVRSAFVLAGYTAWGDRFFLGSDGCTFALNQLRLASDMLLWRMSPDLIRMFERLTART